MLRVIVMAALLAAPAATPALGQSSSSQQLDPNEKVCETIPVIGSRLGKKRVCATRAEWEERKRDDRQAVDQMQKQMVGPCQYTPSSRNGGPVAC